MPPAPTIPAPVVDELLADRPVSPLRLALRKLRRHRLAMVGLWILVALYVLALFADFIAPYGYDNQVRELSWSPPTALHFTRPDGSVSWRPFIYPLRSGGFDELYRPVFVEDTAQPCYLRFFVQGDEHYFLGLVPSRLRLFGFDQPAPAADGEPYVTRFYLLGADLSGRDIFSRICYGSRVSMTIGLFGAAITFVIGMLVGGAAGYFGGRVDGALMRLCEMVMLLPGFYLLLILRFAFPANMDSVKVYFAVVVIMSLIGWAGFARVIRGMVLAIRQMDFVQSARAAGLTSGQIIRRHVLPNTTSYAIVYVTMSVPGYILGESALSLLGLGIMDPEPSWGNMLQKAMEIQVLEQSPWVLWPGAFIFVAVMAFNFLGDGLRDAFDPKTVLAE